MKNYTSTKLTVALLLTLCMLVSPDLWAQQRGQGGGRGGRSGRGAYGANLMGDAVIQFDPETGSIIVIADDDTNEQIGKIIKDLDKPVPQVLIKVLFLEVTHSDGLDLGVDWSFQDAHTDSNGETISGHFLDSVFGVASETRGGFYRIVDNNLEVTLRAMADVAKLEVLSRPSVLVRNNQPATITIGQEVPFIRNSRVTSDGQTINTVEYEDIGIILQVTPHITADGLVDMEVLPEISTLTGETIPISDTINAPVIAKRSAQTNVVVPDGKTVVIGGLMEDNETQTIRKVPILGDIPLLGMAFRRKITSKTKTELLIFLTPYVVSGEAELTEMSISEKDNAELAPGVFSKSQMVRYIDNLDDNSNEDDILD